jgi:hypothetical protein
VATDIIDITDIYAADIENKAKNLIFDRTQSDVDYALECERNGIYTDENLRGAYNISDRNRVGEAVNFIIGCLKGTGIYNLRDKLIKDDWNAYGIITHEDNSRVLSSLENLKRVLPYDKTAAVPESLDSLTYQKANIIENIIFDLYGVFLRLMDSWLYFGDGYLSDFDAFTVIAI